MILLSIMQLFIIQSSLLQYCETQVPFVSKIGFSISHSLKIISNNVDKIKIEIFEERRVKILKNI